MFMLKDFLFLSLMIALFLTLCQGFLPINGPSRTISDSALTNMFAAEAKRLIPASTPPTLQRRYFRNSSQRPVRFLEPFAPIDRKSCFR